MSVVNVSSFFFCCWLSLAVVFVGCCSGLLLLAVVIGCCSGLLLFVIVVVGVCWLLLPVAGFFFFFFSNVSIRVLLVSCYSPVSPPLLSC